MKIFFHLGHPAHYHLFKITIKTLEQEGHKPYVFIKKKDVLEELLISDTVSYKSFLPKGRKDSRIGIALGLIKADWKMFLYCLRNRPDIMVGTSIVNSHVGKLLKIPVININEDDADVVPLYAKLSYPWSNVILSPESCNNGRWNNKTINYQSYHELAYLHPHNFTPDKNVVKKYVDPSKPYYILRLAKLTAHHDKGIAGFDSNITKKLINLLKPHGQIIINSEKPIDNKLEKHRQPIKAVDMHDLLAFADLFIGDSQTMAAEAGVLGTPFIRFNDFVGKISYLEDLENKYSLGFGFKTTHPENMLNKIQELLEKPNTRKEFQEKRVEMLTQKVNFSEFLHWFILNYPSSEETMRKNSDYQYNFK